VINSNGKINKKFLYYSIKNNTFLQQVFQRMTGTTRPAIGIQELRKILVVYPPLQEQEVIAKILFDLDAYIENIQQQNEKLEGIGKTLFKSWFINFDEEKDFVDSEFGKIPKGWNIVNVNQIGKIVTGKTPSTKNKENFGTDYPFITIPDMHDSIFVIKPKRYISEIGKFKIKNFLLPPLSVCISCIATPGLVSLNHTRSFTNQQINSIICYNDISPFFVFFAMKNISSEIIQHASGGTTTPNLNKNDFGKMKILLPSSKQMNKFDHIAKPIFEKIRVNSLLIDNLTTNRNILLPKLMSGDIQI